MNDALTGGVLVTEKSDELEDLRALVDAIGSKSAHARIGHRGLPDEFDAALWNDLQDAGLTRLTSPAEPDAGPVELAVVLRGLARWSASVPVAETDLFGAWLAGRAGLGAPDGPLTVALCDADQAGPTIRARAARVAWTRATAGVVLAVRSHDELLVSIADPTELAITDGHNLAGEPRDTIDIALPRDRFIAIEARVADELRCRAVWARCVQVLGALDATAESTVAHTREREQFGRALSAFQSVQHSLAQLAGEVERFRATTEVAVAAADEHGFGHPTTDFAASVGAVVGTQVVASAVTIAHQLHGAIGTTMEHPLWLATTRAQSWIEEFGSRAHHAERIANRLSQVDDPWDVVIGMATPRSR